jgi:hypothetical protein
MAIEATFQIYRTWTRSLTMDLVVTLQNAPILADCLYSLGSTMHSFHSCYNGVA